MDSYIAINGHNGPFDPYTPSAPCLDGPLQHYLHEINGLQGPLLTLNGLVN